MERYSKITKKRKREIALLRGIGIMGQSVDSMEYDIALGPEYFERICINIMCENSSAVRTDADVIKAFMREIYPKYLGDERVDILINTTDFGIGG